MYREHFKLQERPFTHAPGERFFTANAGVSDALGRLQHLLTARDAVGVVTGGPGVGKTALAEHAIAEVPGPVALARVDLRYGEAEDLYGAILLALGEAAGGLRPAHALHALRGAMTRLARDGQRLILCLDIGGISTDVARHLLRIVNLAGEHGCQMNVILMGPHPLHQQVDVPAMIQLRQRIAFRHRVRPLTLAETDHYVRHQIEAAGADPTAVLSSNVSAAVYCYVAGVPRLINTLLDATLSAACLQKLQRPDGNIIKRTAEGLGWKPMTPPQAGTDPSPRPASTPARPAPARSSPPKVSIVSSSAAERRESPRAAAPAASAEGASDPKRLDLPAPSEMTLQLRTEAGSEGGRFAAVSLAGESRSPTSAIFGGADESAAAEPAASASVLPPPVMPMDAVDTSATGMLRLQDLDERFAETIFGKEAAEFDKKRP